ncbi:MAG: hypothetical protein ACKVQJ_00175 [Pyrinomonadaceae bacterium]
MWTARTKTDLIIEVWEKLDCENIGAAEIEAIEEAVRGQYGESAVESPMRIARTLADEGADLRHSEIMELYIARVSNRPYEAAFRNVLDVSDFTTALRSIRNLESLRRKYTADGDKEGVRLVRETALRGKQQAAETAERTRVDTATREINAEIAEWFTIWLQTPAVFDTWVDLRQNTRDFIEKFGAQKQDF